MTITKQRALAAVGRNGRLLRPKGMPSLQITLMRSARSTNEMKKIGKEVGKMRKILEREVAFLYFRGTGSSRPETSV
ncbi:hypothetical protein HaLaN_31337, partial [Haematococcus lacustris]